MTEMETVKATYRSRCADCNGSGGLEDPRGGCSTCDAMGWILTSTQTTPEQAARFRDNPERVWNWIDAPCGEGHKRRPNLSMTWTCRQCNWGLPTGMVIDDLIGVLTKVASSLEKRWPAGWSAAPVVNAESFLIYAERVGDVRLELTRSWSDGETEWTCTAESIATASEPEDAVNALLSNMAGLFGLHIFDQETEGERFARLRAAAWEMEEALNADDPVQVDKARFHIKDCGMHAAAEDFCTLCDGRKWIPGDAHTTSPPHKALILSPCQLCNGDEKALFVQSVGEGRQRSSWADAALLNHATAHHTFGPSDPRWCPELEPIQANDGVEYDGGAIAP